MTEEAESAALRRFLTDWPLRVTSAVARVEVWRAVRRRGVSSAARELVAAAYDGLGWVQLDSKVQDRAGGLEPPELRSLDAIHLASALEVGPDLGGMVTYDARLAAAARTVGIRVWSPR